MIVNYSSSSEDEQETLSQKRKREEEADDATEPNPQLKTAAAAVGLDRVGGEGAAGRGQRLPLPVSVLQMFSSSEQQQEEEEERERHGGRVRSFQHERGNWATYVFLPYEPEEGFLELVDQLCARVAARGVTMVMADDFHISLSRTVVLRHHWIQPFMESLRGRLAPCQRFVCLAGQLRVYCNAERTRTFVGMEVTAGQAQLLELVRRVDETMEEFNLSSFYKDPSFHVSLAWCLEDRTDVLQDECLSELQDLLDQHEDGPFQMKLNCWTLRCKSGNKVFLLPLR